MPLRLHGLTDEDVASPPIHGFTACSTIKYPYSHLRLADFVLRTRVIVFGKSMLRMYLNVKGRIYWFVTSMS